MKNCQTCSENNCPHYNHELFEPCTFNNCPHGGDIENDCEGCVDSGEFHFVDGECVRRE